MTDDAWFGVTPEPVAEYALFIHGHPRNTKMNQAK